MFRVVVFAFVLLMHGLACEARQPNVVVILTDDQGWGDLSLNGNTNLSTPNIDQLATTGAAFERFFVCPVCSPTRAEFLTGRYHTRGGVYSTSAGGERLDLDEMTIAQTFQSAGYKTAAYGKWHNGMQPPFHPNARGFDDYYGFCSGHWGHYFDPLLEHNGKIVRGEGFVIDDFTNHAMSFMEQNQDQPFFIYLPYNTPHSPMQVPDRWWNKFKNKELTLHNRTPKKENVGHIRAALAMCENIDWNVGRLVKKLDDLKLRDDTIVVYFCDNGPNGVRWNGDMKGRKGSTDEGGVRSPLIVNWPGKISSGIRVQQIGAAIDLLPTLADMANIPVMSEKPLDGQSLKTQLLATSSAETPVNDRLLFSHWKGKLSVRSQRFRLDNKGNLFDIAQDPGQRNNVRQKHAEEARRLETALRDWQQTVVAELDSKTLRRFPMAHPQFDFCQIPARDGIVEGGIVRSNRFPNCSYFGNWKKTSDSISWPVDVLSAGEFDVELYYTLAPANVGVTMELTCGDGKLTRRIDTAHESKVIGAAQDRVKRAESYVKNFRPLKMGTIQLKPGAHELKLTAADIPGEEAIEFRMLMFRRKN